MNLDAIVSLMKAANVLVPLVRQLFENATSDLTNEQRIALLRSAGVELETAGVEWLKSHEVGPNQGA